MKASEIRIGNYVKCDSIPEVGILKISVINKDFVNGCNIELIKPIPLTEEWLLKFGFEEKLNSNNIIYYILAGKCLLEYNLTHNIADIVKKVHLDLFIEIKYVHQIQNLYFALTGEELEINN